MDITPTIINAITTTAHTTITTNAKSPEPESEAPTLIQPTKPFPSSNGVLKRHQPHRHHLLPHHLAGQQFPLVVYRECLKNHAANLGGHAVDGCGEFMPSPSATSTDPTSLKCAACGCHRNFHRHEPEYQPTIPATHVLEYQPHHRHHPPPPPPLPAPNRSPNSASPPPISSYFHSAPHVLLALSSGLPAPPSHALVTPSASTRKRFRTKFSQEQKDKMYQFAERVGWKMQKKDDDLIREICNEIGVERGVLKVWMHNNKNTLAKRHIINGITITNTNTNNDSSLDPNHYQNDSGANTGANGSSSSS